MPRSISLGVHQPGALLRFAAEDLSAAKQFEHLHSRTSHPNDLTSQGDALLIGDRCVVWVQHDIIRRIFRFDAEGETIKAATFANFRLPSNSQSYSSPPFSQSVSKAAQAVSKNDVEEPYAHLLHIPKPALPHSQAVSNDGTKGTSSLHTLAHQCLERAVVIVLESQVHIYSLKGASHLINLPFEVDRVIPLPVGVVLERKVVSPIVSVPSPKLPKSPQNSFARSQSSFVQPLEPQKYRHSLVRFQNSVTKYPHARHGDEHRQSDDAVEQQRLFWLSDPLSDLAVVTADIDVQKETFNSHASSMDRDETAMMLSLQEDLLSVSSNDADNLETTGRPCERLPLLAVTQHSDSGVINFWTGTHDGPNKAKRSIRKPHTDITPGRRSSHLAGAGTGTTTPASRTFIDPRESIGPPNLYTSKSNHVFPESEMHGDDQLLSHLGSALEPHGVASQSTRRVSSLVARGDPGATFGGSVYPGARTFNQHPYNTRRASSFQTYNTRTEIDGQNSYGNKFSRQSASAIQLRHDPEVDDTLSADGVFTLAEDMSETADDGLLDVPKPHFAQDPTLHLSKIHIAKHDQVSNIVSDGIRSIILQPSQMSLSGNRPSPALVICIFSHSQRSLETYEAIWQDSTRRNALRSGQVLKGPRRLTVFGDGIYRISRQAQHRNFQILDVEKVRGALSSCLILLGLTQHGDAEIIVQAPWSKSLRVELPSALNLYNPYRVTDLIGLGSRREGGYKRVLSQGSGQLIHFSDPQPAAQISIVNADHVHNRVELTMAPRNSYVRRIIRICEAVMPPTLANRHFVIDGWQETYRWLSKRWEGDGDIEWLSWLVFTFSLLIPYVKSSRSDTALRPKRRKGGLLRSSSGANTNLESWEAMMDQERQMSDVSPSWLQSGAWQWVPKMKGSKASRPTTQSSRLSVVSAVPFPEKSTMVVQSIALAREYQTTMHEMQNLAPFPSIFEGQDKLDTYVGAGANILLGLHMFREELKLDLCAVNHLHSLTPVLAQLGTWLNWPSWDFRDTSAYAKESVDIADWLHDEGSITGSRIPREPFEPPSILSHLNTRTCHGRWTPFPTLYDLLLITGTHEEATGRKEETWRLQSYLLPRISLVTSSLAASIGSEGDGLPPALWESLPQSIGTILGRRDSKGRSEPIEVVPAHRASTGAANTTQQRVPSERLGAKTVVPSNLESMRDVHSLCETALETEGQLAFDGAAEKQRQQIARMLFKDDQRFFEAARLLHPLLSPSARCDPEPEWSDTDLLEAQQELVKLVALRTLSLSPGRGCLYFNARSPMLTEKFPIHGFTLSCIMKPSDTTVTADRNAYTEEKVSWAFFHAGVEAGLSITKHARGIDTSWILFNKPHEMKNRHAGFLFALGLNGHLKSIVKWVAFRYLTPKHTMTSIGLLLGLSASFLGTMDTLVTRLLSVHVTRMLPQGAAELNLSPLTQTSGIMGIGLLYYRSQHRRMSEVMLSEIENVDEDYEQSGTEALHDESYRLAAGFSLGYINLGQGNYLKGLFDMRLLERLLAVAVGSKKVNLVHLLDKAAPGAIIAIALIYMKTENQPLASKIDIPDTVHQYEDIRSDIFLLRTLARHLIMWKDIRSDPHWVTEQLPEVYQALSSMTCIRALNTQDMAFYNIIAGICLAIGLRYAGSRSVHARDTLLFYLDNFMRLCKIKPLDYDSKLTRITVRNCQDVVALAAASVMAGSGDVLIFRRLRSLHGRTDAFTPYGSHVAAHLAIGILFIGGGTHTLGTSDLAVASLLCAFYPLFPNTVLDNKVHLQAFRHFWVLAAEARCLIVHDIEARRPVSLPVTIKLRSGQSIESVAPCLVPELDEIAMINLASPEYCDASLNFVDRPSDLQAFRSHQTLLVRRRSTDDVQRVSLFNLTIQTLNNAQRDIQTQSRVFQWIFTLKALGSIDKAKAMQMLPSDMDSSQYSSLRNTAVDDQLVLEKDCEGSDKSERLWNLRLLFTWAEYHTTMSSESAWLSKEYILMLKARLAIARMAQQ